MRDRELQASGEFIETDIGAEAERRRRKEIETYRA
jgi:hypothetical protein